MNWKIIFLNILTIGLIYFGGDTIARLLENNVRYAVGTTVIFCALIISFHNYFHEMINRGGAK